MNETRRIPLNVHHFVRDGMHRTDAGLLEIEELNEMVNDALTNGDRKRAEKVATEAAAMVSLAPEAWAVLERIELVRRGFDKFSGPELFEVVNDLLKRRDTAAGGSVKLLR